MLAWDLFRHYLLSKRAGSTVRIIAWLCILGVGIGVMALVIVLSIMNGFNGSIKNRLLAVEPHLVISFKDKNQVREIESSEVYQQLKSDKSLQVESFESQDVIIRTAEGLYGGAVARSVEKQSLKNIFDEVHKADIQRRAVKKSEDLVTKVADETIELAQDEVIVGVDLARSLGIFEGDQIVAISPETLLLPKSEIPKIEKLKVKAMISTNIPEIDSKLVFYARDKSFTHLRTSASHEAGIEVRLPNPEDFSSLKKELEKKGALVDSWRDRNSSLFYALRLEKFAMGAVLSLSALIASFSIITVLVLLLTQKRKDMGVLMAMGLSKRDTRNLFLKLGLSLSSMGLFGGLFLGIAICFLIDHYPLPILPDIYYDATIPAKVDPLFILAIIIFAAIISFLSAWLPATRYTNLNPSEALRARSNQPET
jgi:lipoprotein-releasing system permease protein